MKAVILAAGQGIRLRPLTAELPKCLLTVGEQTLLERSLDLLQASGITHTIIVVGFRGDLIRKQIGLQYGGMSITYVENERYATTGSMYSLSQAQAVLDDDILLLESDLLYDGLAIDRLLGSGCRDAILISALLNSGDDVYVYVNSQRQVTQLGKVIPQRVEGQLAGCLVGISRFSHTFLDVLFTEAQADYAQGALLYHYEECVLKASRTQNPVYAVLAENLVWTEIDTPDDLQRARTDIYPRLIGKATG